MPYIEEERIFHEILYFEWAMGKTADIVYPIDRSHNLKGKIEAMIQTVTMAQEPYCAWLLTLASVLLVGSTVIVGYGNYVALER